jgi:hypothetical protein
LNYNPFQINGRQYSIHVTDDDPILIENPDAFGFCDHTNLRIVARKSVSPRILQETLLHEILHAILDSSGAMTAIEKVERCDVDEVLISALVPSLLRFIDITQVLSND